MQVVNYSHATKIIRIGPRRYTAFDNDTFGSMSYDTYDTFLLLLPLLQIRCQLPPSARTLHYFDESTHNSVQRLQPLRHVGREEPENDSVLVHQLLELVCFVHRCIVTHQQKTLSREFIRSRPRRLLLLPPRRQYSLNVHGKPPCVHPRLGLAGDNVPIHVLQIPAHMLKLALAYSGLGVFCVRLKYSAISPVSC